MSKTLARFRHRQVEADGISFHVVEAGSSDKPTLLFLHGWPLEKLPRSRRYRLAHKGYSICVLLLKLFERIYAPLTAGLLKPFTGDRNLAPDKRCQLDRLYQRPADDLDALLSAVGLKTAG
jgi:pimeloyl-ACP methyl ester carboxylesterase